MKGVCPNCRKIGVKGDFYLTGNQTMFGSDEEIFICDNCYKLACKNTHRKKEEEQNKIVVTISVVSSEVDLDSPIFKRAKMPRLTEFPGGIKEEEES